VFYAFFTASICVDLCGKISASPAPPRAESTRSQSSSQCTGTPPTTPTTSKPASLLTFEVAWDKMPPALLSTLVRNERPTPALRREMVRLISADIYAVYSHPGRKQLRSLAEKIVNTYPSSFRDMAGDEVVGSGYDSLMLQLESRHDNLNRGKHTVKQ